MGNMPAFYAARNDRDSERFGEELWGVRPADGRGWCAVTYGIRTSMASSREEAEAKAAKLNEIARTLA